MTEAQLRTEFAKMEGLKRNTTGHVCWHRLVEGRCPAYTCNSPDPIPSRLATDGYSWRRGKGHVITFSPYLWDFDDAMQDWLYKFCDEHGLQWKELPWMTWRLPGETTVVVIEKEE